jgi:1-acyl-sn-glycerol-3-phosphate acyltransferase
MFENDALHFVKRAPWLQIVRLWSANHGRASDLAAREIGNTARGAFRTWLIWKLGYGFGMIARVFPSPATAHGLTRTAARWLLASRGVKPRAANLENIPAGPAVLIANRAGKFDALIAATAIPGTFLFANRIAFEPLPPAIAFLLDPLAVPPAEQITTPPGGTLRQRIQQALERGHRVLVFAEGPAGVEPERSRYRLEAIQAAHATGARIIPLRISGSAHVFEESARPAAAVSPEITAGSAMTSEGDDPRNLVEIRDQIRRAIASLGQ